MENDRPAARIAWMDVFRAVMIAAIVLGHACKDAPAARTYVYSFHVAAFFFASGYLFRTGEAGFGRFLVGKLRSLVVPYAIFALLSILIFAVLGRFASASLGIGVRSTAIPDNLYGMVYASAKTGLMKWNLPLWFVPCLFVTEALFYFLAKTLDRVSRRMGVHPACAGLFALSLVVAFANYYLAHIRGLPWGVETAFYLLPFFTLGFWLRRSSLRPETLRRAYLAAAGGVLLAAGGVLAFVNSPVDYVSDTYGALPLFYLAAVCSIAGCVCFSVLLSGAKRLAYLGRNTFPVLLMHKFPVLALQILTASLLTGSQWRNTALGAGIAIAAIVLSLAVGALLGRHLPFALGRRKSGGRRGAVSPPA